MRMLSKIKLQPFFSIIDASTNDIINELYFYHSWLDNIISFYILRLYICIKIFFFIKKFFLLKIIFIYIEECETYIHIYIYIYVSHYSLCLFIIINKKIHIQWFWNTSNQAYPIWAPESKAHRKNSIWRFRRL